MVCGSYTILERLESNRGPNENDSYTIPMRRVCDSEADRTQSCASRMRLVCDRMRLVCDSEANRNQSCTVRLRTVYEPYASRTQSYTSRVRMECESLTARAQSYTIRERIVHEPYTIVNKLYKVWSMV